MAKLNDTEAARLKELVALKKAGKLSDSDSAELEKLNGKCGFRAGKRGGKKSRDNRGKASLPYGNDYAWWNKYPELLTNAASVPFNWRPGTGLFCGGLEDEMTNKTGVPGVMSIGYLPMCGSLTGDSTDPFNTAIRALWLDMHRKYRGIGAYQQADLGMAIFAIANVFGLILTAERIVGYLLWYDTLNLNLPRNLAAAMGISTSLLDSIHRNSKDYIGYLNYLITKLKPLCLPRGLSFIQNLASCLSYVYLDSKDHRAQMFLFRQFGYWEYDGANFGTGSSLVLKDEATHTATALPNAGHTDYASYLGAIESVIDGLLGDDDITRMCSDVLAAYGDTGIEFMQMIPDGFMLSPVYSEEMLHKIHNANIINYRDASSIYNLTLGNTRIPSVIASDANYSKDKTYIYQVDNTIIGNFTTRLVNSSSPYGSTMSQITDSSGNTREVYSNNSIYAHAAMGSTLLDTWQENPGPEVVVEGCMFKHSCNGTQLPVGGTTYYEVTFTTIGVELLIAAQLFAQNGVSISARQFRQWNAYAGGTVPNIEGTQVFDWAPYIYGFKNSISIAHDIVYALPVGDINNAVHVRPNDLFRIHQIALLSAFKFDTVTYIQ